MLVNGWLEPLEECSMAKCFQGVEQLPLGEGGALDLATEGLDLRQLYQGLKIAR